MRYEYHHDDVKDDGFICSECDELTIDLPVYLWDDNGWEYKFCKKCFLEWMVMNNKSLEEGEKSG